MQCNIFLNYISIITISDLVTSVLQQNVESTSTASSVARVPKSVMDLDDTDNNNSVSGLAEMVNDSVLSQSSSAIIKSQKLEYI